MSFFLPKWSLLTTFPLIKIKIFMKKLLTILALSVFVMAFASCKKEYSCECTTTTAGQSASATATIKDTKKNATDKCDEGDRTTNVGGVTSTTECEIK